jgi:hypothetical protein
MSVTGAILLSIASLLAVPSLQAPDAPAAFAVVSIKENKSGPPSAGGDRFVTVFSPVGRFAARNATLRDLVLTAYRDELPASRISGFADWMSQTRFDVEARTRVGDVPAGDVPPVAASQLQLMLRSRRTRRRVERQPIRVTRSPRRVTCFA